MMGINFRKYQLRLMKTSLKPWRDQNVESLSLEKLSVLGATIIPPDSKTFLKPDTLSDTTGT